MKSQTNGDLEQAILRSLRQGDLYSLEIIEAIKSHHRIGLGSLYLMLHKLEKKGYVASYWGEDRPVERNRARRKYYRLTETGREVLCLSESSTSTGMINIPKT